MGTLQQLETVFNIFHDGTIAAWKGDKSLLNLTVECQYLAEKIDPAFDTFYLNLITIDTLALEPSSFPIAFPQFDTNEVSDIFMLELAVLSAEIEADCVVISCDQYTSGMARRRCTLRLSCESITVFDQTKNELSIDQLKDISQSYWDNFGKR